MSNKTYTVDEIENNVAKVRFSNGEFTFIELESNMTEADFDDAVHRRMPAKIAGGGGTPSFLRRGESRTAAQIAEPTVTVTYADNRLSMYGSAEDQIEYITENGLEAWQARVAEIKAQWPKD